MPILSVAFLSRFCNAQSGGSITATSLVASPTMHIKGVNVAVGHIVFCRHTSDIKHLPLLLLDFFLKTLHHFFQVSRICLIPSQSTQQFPGNFNTGARIFPKLAYRAPSLSPFQITIMGVAHFKAVGTRLPVKIFYYSLRNCAIL